jgi:hypothetical protein
VVEFKYSGIESIPFFMAPAADSTAITISFQNFAPNRIGNSAVMNCGLSIQF